MATSSAVGRIAAFVALGVAVLVLGIVLLGGGSSYTVTAQFQNAAQLVNGNQVEVAGVPAGTIKDISLGPNGSAEVKMEINSDYAPLHEGTVATVRSQSLSGIANRYVQLQMPAADKVGAAIPDGGTLPLSDTVSEVDLDQLFNTLDKRTIGHFKDVIKGFARAYEGIGPQTNAGFKYLNPFLSTSRQVFSELTLDQRRFEHLIVDAASLSGAIAERSPDLEQFVSNTNTMMGAIASENQALASAVGQLPDFMRNFDTTAVNLRATLDDLDPLVNASKPVALKLQPFTRQLRGFARDAVPTVTDLDAIVKRPGSDNDLINLTNLQAPLAKIAVGPVNRNGKSRQGALPEARQALAGGLAPLSFLRPYVSVEGISGWFNDFGPGSGLYDSNGGMTRISTTFNVFGTISLPGGVTIPDFSNLIPPASQLTSGLTVNQLNRCPGANERNPGDNSTPFTDNGTLACDPSQVPPGP